VTPFSDEPSENLNVTSTSESKRLTWPFERSTSDMILAGVAGGIAARLGIRTVYVRAAFISSSLAAGVGIIVYLLSALLVPMNRDTAKEDRAPATPPQVIGLVLMFIAVMLVFQSFSIWFGPVVWPATLVTFGLAIAIDTSGVNYEKSLAGITGSSSGRRSWWLVVGGLVMMVAGFAVVFSSLDALKGVGVLLLALLAALAGLSIVAGPWVWSLIEDLRTERRARIRSEEKADMAAHLHDSVLQTFALIQRTDDPKKMVTLARSQERELRSWLFDEKPSDTQSLRGALSDAANSVEEAHDVPVSTVVVGDSSLPSDRQAALVGAATEAMMNAAKHSGADRVSVFAEANDGTVEVFVTDQGDGFDVEAVDEDRKGLAESIKGRMSRHGGEVAVDSEIGVGTEIHLTMTGGTP
jgi:signal transduction histidine kinase/phage shock protein PspC (stress-responsive transcriptional regulator)